MVPAARLVDGQAFHEIHALPIAIPANRKAGGIHRGTQGDQSLSAHDRHLPPHYFIPTVACPNRRPVRHGQQPLCVHLQPKCVILVCRQSERNCVFGSGDNQVSDPFWTLLQRESKAAKSRLQSCQRRIGQLGPVAVRFPRKAPVFSNRGAVPRERTPYRRIGMVLIVPVGPVVPGSGFKRVFDLVSQSAEFPGRQDAMDVFLTQRI